MIKISIEVVSLGKDKCSVNIINPEINLEKIKLSTSYRQEQECIIMIINQLKKYLNEIQELEE